MYQRKDHYYYKAQKEGYYARSAYKLIELQKKYHIIGQNSAVLDLGCSPGSWLQVAKKFTRGKVVGIDLTPPQFRNAEFILGDVCDPAIIAALDRQFDVVLSDLAPKTSGIVEKDSALSYDLSFTAFLLALKVLKHGGNFLVKMFQSNDTQRLVTEMKKHFSFVKQYVPKATRQRSREIYLIGLHFLKEK